MKLRIYMEDDTSDFYLGCCHVRDFKDFYHFVKRLYKHIRLKKRGV